MAAFSMAAEPPGREKVAQPQSNSPLKSSKNRMPGALQASGSDSVAAQAGNIRANTSGKKTHTRERLNLSADMGLLIVRFLGSFVQLFFQSFHLRLEIGLLPGNNEVKAKNDDPQNDDDKGRQQQIIQR